MNTLMKRNGSMPNTAFSGLVDNFFQGNLNRLFDDRFWGFRGVQHAGSVPVNIRETDKSYELELVAPGLKKEDFKVNINGTTLTVSFEQQQQNDQSDNNESWLHKEYRLHTFSRSFELNDMIEAGGISARYTDGILYMTLPKKEGATGVSHTIQIQ